MTKIEVVDLDEFYNIYIDDFFSWDNLVFQNLIWSCIYLKFKFWIVQTKSHENMNKLIAVRTQQMVRAWF